MRNHDQERREFGKESECRLEQPLEGGEAQDFELRWPQGSQTLTDAILQLLNRGLGMKEAIAEMLWLVQEFTRLERVTVWLRKTSELAEADCTGSGDYCGEHQGSLYRRNDKGNLVRTSWTNRSLERICNALLSGLKLPSLPFFTEGGSFFTNCASDDLGPAHGSDRQSPSRNRRKRPSYESVGLVPLRSGLEAIGILQLSDPRRGCFTPESILFLERIGTTAGTVLKRIFVENAWRKDRELERQRDQERAAEMVVMNQRLWNEIQQKEEIQCALDETGTRYRALIEAAKDIIWNVDKDLRFTYVSPSVTSVLGYSVKEIMGMRLLDLLTPESRARMLSILEEELNQKREGASDHFASRTEGIEQYHKDGSVRWMEIAMTFLHDDEGLLIGILGTSRDTTERKRLDQAKSDFLTRIAHELRGPLTSIRGYSELLVVRDDLTASEQEKCLKRINEQAASLSDVISQLIDISHLESDGDLRTDVSPCCLGTVISETVDSFRKESRPHRFELVVPEQSVEAHVDGRKVKEILERILSNAVAYSPGGGLIRVVCSLSGDEIHISVEDQGIGMTGEEVERVFDGFYRADTSGAAPPGKGLGMTVVRCLVQAMGGSVRVESEQGKGTAVRVTLPIRFPDSTQGGTQVEENTRR